MGNPRRLYVADKSKPEIRQRQPQTNTRKCGTQPAHKSMPAVVKMPCLLLCSTASRMRAFVLKAGKERVMIKELANGLGGFQYATWRGGSNRRKRVAFIMRSVGAGCGDDPGIVCRGLVSER